MRALPSFAVALVACSQAVAEPSKLDPRDVAAIKEAVAKYPTWGRVDQSPSMAALDCSAPEISRVRRSDTDGETPHGKKLYFLWASDRAAFRDAKKAIPTGFAIVKQSFGAKVLDTRPAGVDMGKPITWLDEGGKVYGVDKPKDLFVMTKVGERDGADAGWIYGTVAPDGTVTSAGKVTSCSGCHASATHERLFGLKH